MGGAVSAAPREVIANSAAPVPPGGGETPVKPPTAAHRHSDGGWDEGSRWPAMLLIIALHIGALWGLMQIESVRKAVEEAAPIMVGLITLPPPEPPKPKIEPPPKPAPVKPKPKPQMIAAETAAPSEMVAPVPEPVIPEPPPPPPPAPPAPPAPIIPPNFVAAYLDNPPPVYPSASKRLGETGTVLLRVLVDEQGQSKSIEIQSSSGYSRLDRAALDAVRKWKFVPAKQGDRAISAAVLVPLTFELKNS